MKLPLALIILYYLMAPLDISAILIQNSPASSPVKANLIQPKRVKPLPRIGIAGLGKLSFNIIGINKECFSSWHGFVSGIPIN